jgi:AcrR family transcriptional regulator
LSKQALTTADTPDTVSTRERLVREAMRLFAEKGYRATTVGEIEEAAGLSPRAGGLYRHFASKRELFEAGIAPHGQGAEEAQRMLSLLPFEDLRSDLTVVARWTLAELRAERQMIKILQRDGRDFPEIQQAARERVIQRGYATAESLLAHWLKTEPGPRVQAFSTALFSSLVSYHLLDVMAGWPPGGLTEEEFADAWVGIAERAVLKVLEEKEEAPVEGAEREVVS